MENEEIISAQDFCTHYNVEFSFVQSLYESGLLQLIYKEEKIFVPVNEMPHLEKLVRMHYDMDINLEGIETICYLLNKMNDMQQEINQLSHRLRLLE